MVSSVTDLPAPFGPRSTRISPREREVDAIEAERAKGQRQRFDRNAGRHRFSRSGAPHDSARNRRNNASDTKSNSTAALAA